MHYCANGAWNSHHCKKFRFLGIVLLTMSHKSDNEMIGLFPEVLCSITKIMMLVFSIISNRWIFLYVRNFLGNFIFPFQICHSLKKLKQLRQSLRHPWQDFINLTVQIHANVGDLDAYSYKKSFKLLSNCFLAKI